MLRILYRRIGKRCLDLVGAVSALVCLSPLLVLLAVLIRIKLGQPVLFVQARSGRGGRPFQMCKFRSMTNARNERGELLPDEQRLTRFGHFLRSSSLDELPELWNVVRGDMSLIGPRPLIAKYIDRYTPEQRRRHDVRPGITGWAQVNGRNTISWEDRLRLDVWYTDHYGLGLDLRIVWRTLIAVVNRQDINANGNATMPEFLGRSNGVDHSEDHTKRAA